MVTENESPTPQTALNPSVTLDIDMPARLNRVRVLLRVFIVIPIAVIMGLLLNNGTAVAIGTATALMLVFRRKYPRWWFDFQVELNRFVLRVSAYYLLMSDQYPATDAEQSVRYHLQYPDTAQLSRVLPLFKWLLALPHYIVIFFLGFAGGFLLLFSWFYALVTGKPNKFVFNWLLGFGRYYERVFAYAILVATDQYPAFSFER